MVFPTPGGPESRAALNPEPSSLPPPNLPNLAATQQETGQSEFSLNTKFSETKLALRSSFYNYCAHTQPHNTNRAKPSDTCWPGGTPAVMFVPVLQPAEQLIGTTLVSLLANHSLQRERAVLVHPQQTLSGWCLWWSCRGWWWRGGREAQAPPGCVTWASPRWSAAIFGPGSVALSQAGLWRARGVRGPGISLRGRYLLGSGCALWGLAGRCPGLWGFALNILEIKI